MMYVDVNLLRSRSLVTDDLSRTEYIDDLSGTEYIDLCVHKFD